jgi:hypothetical protein
MKLEITIYIESVQYKRGAMPIEGKQNLDM